MREWNQYCLIDIFSQIDPSMLEEEFLEEDLDKVDLWQTEKQKWSKKKIAAITGVAAGAVAITGAVILFCTKNMKKAA